MAPLAMLAGFACGLGRAGRLQLPAGLCRRRRRAGRDRGALWLSAFVIGNVVLQWPIGWVADHFDRRVVLAGCALASTLLVIAAVDGPGAIDRASSP